MMIDTVSGWGLSVGAADTAPGLGARCFRVSDAPGVGARRAFVARPVPKKAVAAVKSENRLVHYFKEVRAEIRKVTWPSRREATNLTLIVLAVTAAASVFMGVVDWVFARIFALIVG